MSTKVSFLTTTGVNVGDEFIREGIRSVLDRSGIPYQPFYVNKHNATSLWTACEDEPASVSDKYWDADVFMQAGAPVYWYHSNGGSTSLTSDWHEWMWNERILKQSDEPAPRFVNLGAGSCQPWGDDGSAFIADPGCAGFARRAGARADLTTVRDPVSGRILDALGIPHETLPCPAFLAAMRHGPARLPFGAIGVNLMPLAGHYALDSAFNGPDWLVKCYLLLSRLRKLSPLLFIAHDLPERSFLSQFAAAGERVFWSANWRDYLDVYAGCSLVIANRVHGAVCAAGFGVPSMIIGNDTRASIGEFIGLPIYRGARCDPEEAGDTAAALLRNRCAEMERLRSLRETTLEQYTALVSPILQEAASRQPSRGASPSAQGRFAARVEFRQKNGLADPFIREFSAALENFALRHGIPALQDESTDWACAWLWMSGLRALDWRGLRTAIFNSGTHPLPCFLAALGAPVTLLDASQEFIPQWEAWRQKGFDISWRPCGVEATSVPGGSADVVIAFSTGLLELADFMNEADRILRPGGLLGLSFAQAASAGPRFGIGELQSWANSTKSFTDIDWPSSTLSRGLGESPGAALLQKTTAGIERLPRFTTESRYHSTQTQQRLDDLLSLRNALQTYRNAWGVYPISSSGWDGLHSEWGLSTAEWIPGLVPEFLSSLPRDPARTADPRRQYLYRSDGSNFKLLCHGAPDYETIGSIRPDMLDPVRPGWAYGFWSDAAARW